MTRFNDLKEVALVFTKLGIASFGGPVAHIAMMEKEVVGNRRWMGRGQSATSFLPI